LNQGSTFYIQLPLPIDDAAGLSQASARQDQAGA
jgi:hypothetical protein